MKFIQIKIIIIFNIFLLGNVTVTYSQSNIEEFKVLDVTQTDNKSSYYIGFYARKGMPGHAFVVLGKHENNQCSLDNAVGFYAKSNNPKELFLGKPYNIGEGFPKNEDIYKDPDCFEKYCPTSLERTTHVINFRVDKNKYDIAKKIIDDYAKNPEKMGGYKPIYNDCISFIVKIGQGIGLDINRTDAIIPQSYIQSMINRVNPLRGDPSNFYPLKLDGKRVVSFSNGTFIGTLQDGYFFTGKGVFNGNSNNDLVRYTGGFKQGKIYGYGKAIYKDYEIEGFFKAGVIDGDFIHKMKYKGNTKTTKGKIYKVGISENEDYIISCSSGWTYKGRINGFLAPHGKGIFSYPDGKKLIGTFKNGNNEGSMKLLNINGSYSTWIVSNGKVALSSFHDYNKNGQPKKKNNSQSSKNEHDDNLSTWIREMREQKASVSNDIGESKVIYKENLENAQGKIEKYIGDPINIEGEWGKK